MARLLIVEDKDSLRLLLMEALRGAGHEVQGARNAEAGLTLLKSAPRIELLLSDLKLPGMNGLALLDAARALAPDLPVILMTGYGTVPDAVSAIKRGATDFLLKPLDLTELENKVAQALLSGSSENSGQNAAPAPYKAASAPLIVGNSPALEQARQSALSAAASEMPVLFTGESGTGKELFARLIHHASPRRHAPFIAVNCAAIPDALLENELFGHEKGAYTGAVSAQPGRFERASGGTLFLDEIGDMPHALQSKLLRVLQEKTYERLGGATKNADVRVVAATNSDLHAAMDAGQFRQDLYFRIAAFPIRLPPLRERLDDLAPLASHYLPRLALQHRRTVPSLSPAALQLLRAHPWPGNIREFANALERAMIASKGLVLMPDDFNFLGKD